MKVLIAAGIAAFAVTLFWLANLYRRVPDYPSAGWREYEDVDYA